ncbi:hypothetical protein FRC08_013575 [Ceratobasidium sp. 394]|nr:hypothetical protein FRC08_013575 [Ceratobasidium sp. 394]
MTDKPTTLARINTLPPEIFPRIFALAKLYCLHNIFTPYQPHQFNNFADVCRYWRQIAIDTTDLWTHIDIGPKTPTSLTQLLLERTRGSPIHIHFYEPAPLPGASHSTTGPYDVIPILKPYILQVRSLDLDSYAYSTENVGFILNLWLDYGSTTLPRSLFINRPFCTSLLSADEEGRPGTRVSQSENSRMVLSSIRTLHLHGAVLPWDSGAYFGLTDLRLEFREFSVCISQSQFAGILSASPALTILILSSLTITRTGGWNQHTPTLLGSLKFLDLRLVDPDSLQLLLPLIALPDPPNGLSVSLPAHQKLRGTLEAFFARSHTGTLYYESIEDTESLSPLGSLPRIDKLLILYSFYIGSGQLTETNPLLPQSPTAHPIHNNSSPNTKSEAYGLNNATHRPATPSIQ